jgi:hypothetical protein
LGGDGTVLFTSWLFQRIVPPVLPFALGSLGFLTNFDFADYAKTLDKAVDDGIRVNLRMRFTCTVYRAVTPEQAAVAACKKRKAIKSSGGDILLNQVDAEGWEALEGTKQHDDDQKPKSKGKKDKEIMCFSTRPVETFEVLNDLVVDRGPSPYVSLLELFGEKRSPSPDSCPVTLTFHLFLAHRRRSSPNDRSSGRTLRGHSNRIDRIFLIRWRIIGPSRYPCTLDLPHLSPYPFVPTYAVTRRDGIEGLRAVQLSKYGLG